MYTIDQLRDWGDSLDWAPLPSKALRKFRSHCGEYIEGRRAAYRLSYRYELLRRHPNRHLVPTLTFLDEAHIGRVTF